MALHRDIYWIGRQWAVTGFGVQAVDQRLDGAFDIEASELWDEDGPARIRAQEWVYLVDFEKALAFARQRFPESGKSSLPLVESVLEMIQRPSPRPSGPGKAGLQPNEIAAPRDDVSSSAPPLHLQIRTQGALARFVPQWRVRR